MPLSIKTVSYAFVVAILCASCAPTYAQTGPTGTWRVEGTGNPFPWEMVLRVDGSRLSGAVSSCASPTVDIYEGRIDGNTLTFKCKSLDNARTTTFTGRINGDEITFTRDTQVREGGDPPAANNGMFAASAPTRFTAKRVPDGALAQLVDGVRGHDFTAGVNVLPKDVKAEGSLFLPEGIGRVRAVIVATGWGRGFDFYDDPQLRNLLRAMESGILLARTTFISTPQLSGQGKWNNAAAGGADTLLMLLQRLAGESGHPELAEAPLLFFGHSAGGAFGPTFAALHPERTLAFVRYQSGGGTAEGLSPIPALIIAGGKDTAAGPGADVFWKKGRSLGAPWTFAVQPDATHGDLDYLKKADDLILPWISSVLRQRLSADGATLRAVPDNAEWMGNNQTGEIARYSAYSGSKAEASWLPDEATARAWQTVLGAAK